ncbi:unnamed protein product [Owenia fusiformis]|uniref:Uncharacterized protein n=1 Tax=Owenia fusiformis TaxID=6347 RepID=A0A8S4Q6J0_OWEFU|nr:unnamed protein product [Owenia fusiformis]
MPRDRDPNNNVPENSTLLQTDYELHDSEGYMVPSDARYAIIKDPPINQDTLEQYIYSYASCADVQEDCQRVHENLRNAQKTNGYDKDNYRNKQKNSDKNRESPTYSTEIQDSVTEMAYTEGLTSTTQTQKHSTTEDLVQTIPNNSKADYETQTTKQFMCKLFPHVLPKLFPDPSLTTTADHVVTHTELNNFATDSKNIALFDMLRRTKTDEMQESTTTEQQFEKTVMAGLTNDAGAKHTTSSIRETKGHMCGPFPHVLPKLCRN